jgi:O-antigen/teichoic acid export membrane protein
VPKALLGIYALLIPAMLILVLCAPLILGLFGREYSDGAAPTLQLLALSAVFTGGTYIVDVALAARDRVRAYVLMNAVNATFVLVAVGVLLPQGLTYGALGWLVAQAASLGFGVVLLVLGSGLRAPFNRAPGRA